MTNEISFDRYIGMGHVEIDDGEQDDCLRSRIVVQPHHQNPTGYVNGGVILALADNLATGMAGRAQFAKTGERSFWVGIDVHTAMLSNQQGGELLAESRRPSGPPRDGDPHGRVRRPGQDPRRDHDDARSRLRPRPAHSSHPERACSMLLSSAPNP